MSFQFENNDSNGFQKDPADVFNQFTKQTGSAMKWASVESSVTGVVFIIAIVAVVYAIIDCLKKAGNAIPGYTRISNIDSDQVSKQGSSSTDHVSITMEPEFQAIQQFPTMEGFLRDMATEKPLRFSHQQIDEFTNNRSNILGSGGYGVVFKGELTNGVSVAVKVLTNHANDKKMEQQFKAEVSTIGRTYHGNLVKLYGYCFDPGMMMALVYEYMENGSLNKFLFNENQNHEIELEKLHKIAIGTAKGIAYLHEECEPRIFHYDIKPENILLDDGLNPKVADFGLAKLCNRTESKVVMSGGRGTLGYSAPEVWNCSHPVTSKCDVYSFGILLFEIVGRRRHFDAKLTESRQWLPKWTWEMYKNNELEVMLSLCGIPGSDRDKAKRMCSVALLCIQDLPDARPVMSDVVKMLEGGMEILNPLPEPFKDSGPGALNLLSEMESDEETNMSESRKHLSEQYYPVASTNHMHEIELATC